MDAKLKPRWARIEKTLNDVLVAANGCLAVIAILLVSLMFIELQIASWQGGDSGAGAPSIIEISARAASPPPG
jgi:hypothetical protein